MALVRSILKNFFDWLVEENILEVNPVSKVRSYKYTKKGNNALEYHEILKLRESNISLRERALLEVLLSTGCKLSEIKELKKEQVDFTTKTIKIDSEDRNRVVFITPKAEGEMLNYLNSRVDSNPYLFITERKPFRQLSSRAIQQIIERISVEANLTRKISPKTFRDTFTRFSLDHGVSFNMVQALLGYTTSSSETYFKITRKNIWEIIKVRPDF